MEIVGEAGGVVEAVTGIDSTKPDVVLLDVHMPDGGGVAVLGRIDGLGVLGAERVRCCGGRHRGDQGGCPRLRHQDDLRAGSCRRVRRVAGGDAVFSPRLAGFVLDSFTGRSTAPEPPLDPELDSLTPRELEVLRLLARGYTYREIAEELVISVKTVETHASNVLRKTQQSNRNALTRWAHRRRID